MNTLYSLYVWIVWALHLLLAGPVLVPITAASPRLGMQGLRLVARSAFFFAGIRVSVRGQELVDWSGAYVFMGNHQSNLDPFVLVLAIKRHMVGIEKKENLKVPIYGWLTRAWGNIPIDRHNPEAARQTIDLAVERLKEGTSITILPEGTRTLTGEIGPFKKGGFHLAVNAGAAIVPFTFNGVYERLRPNDWHIHPGLCEVVFHPPISTAGVGREGMAELIERVRAAIASDYTGVAERYKA